MRIFDLSVGIDSNTFTWPGDAPVKISQIKSLKKDGVALSDLHFGSHTGTHIDAVKHFVADGVGIDKISLEKLIGEVKVIQVKAENNLIQPESLDRIDFKTTKKLILKTENTKQKLMLTRKFTPNYVSLSLPAAKILADNKIVFIGTDYLSIEKKASPGHPVHKTLLEAGVVIAEGLNLTQVPQGEYQLFAGPVKVKDCDGAPARVFLVAD